MRASGRDGLTGGGRLRHGVLDDADEDLLDRLAVPRVAQDDGHIRVEVEGLADGVRGVTDAASKQLTPTTKGMERRSK